MPFEYEQKIDAKDGNNISLTIDETIQHIMENMYSRVLKRIK